MFYRKYLDAKEINARKKLNSIICLESFAKTPKCDKKSSRPKRHARIFRLTESEYTKFCDSKIS